MKNESPIDNTIERPVVLRLSHPEATALMLALRRAILINPEHLDGAAGPCGNDQALRNLALLLWSAAEMESGGDLPELFYDLFDETMSTDIEWRRAGLDLDE